MKKIITILHSYIYIYESRESYYTVTLTLNELSYQKGKRRKFA